MTKYPLFFLVFIGGTILDQLSKIWVVRNIREYGNYEQSLRVLEKFGLDKEAWLEMPYKIDIIPNFFALVHTQNRGAAFGIMEGQMIVFAVFTLLAVGVIGWTLHQLPSNDRFQNIALALLASGTLGNAIDRMHKQSVTDFLHVYSNNESIKPILVDILGSNAWPSFNIADAAIVIGMLMFAFFYIFLEKDEEDEQEDVENPKGMVEGL